jgi:hypothetical protein
MQKTYTKEDIFYATLNETFLIIEPFLNKNGFKYTMRHFEPSRYHDPNYVSIISVHSHVDYRAATLVIAEETLLVAKTHRGIYRVFDLHDPSALSELAKFLKKMDPLI